MSWSPQSYLLLGNNVAYFFSDAAATNACIAMYEIQAAAGKLGLLFSNRSHYPHAYDSLVKSAVPAHFDATIDCVFTGTSHPESSQSFEVEAIRQARADGKYTISFIDHWNNFRLRFEALPEGEWPDEIWVIDEGAKNLAIAEGLPPNRLRVTGNPYHHYLRHQWQPKWTDKAYLTQFGIPIDRLHILFAPDPFSIRGMHEKTGFTEGQALRDIASIFADQADAFLIIKAHPLQPEDRLRTVLSEFPELPFALLKDGVDVPELLNASDLVIGFHSNLLLEAAALGKAVIRYFPGNPESDLLLHSKLVPPACENPAEIKNQIQTFARG